MGFRKKISLSVISAACVFAFVACGNNISTPKCGDKDVQEKIVEMILKEGIGGGIKEIEAMVRNMDEKDKDKLIKRMGLQNIITEETDEAKKKVTCKANLKIDIDTLKDIELVSYRELHKKTGILKPGEEVTLKNLEEIAARMFYNLETKDKVIDKAQREKIMEEARKEARKQVREFEAHIDFMLENLQKEEIGYTAQRTDDGKLIVKHIANEYNDY